MNRPFVLAIVLVGVFLGVPYLWNQQQPQPRERPSLLVGVVKIGNAPVAGAKVWLPEFQQSTVTDAEGVFELFGIPVPPDTVVRLMASTAGYETRPGIDVKTGDRFQVVQLQATDLESDEMGLEPCCGQNSGAFARPDQSVKKAMIVADIRVGGESYRVEQPAGIFLDIKTGGGKFAWVGARWPAGATGVDMRLFQISDMTAAPDANGAPPQMVDEKLFLDDLAIGGSALFLQDLGFRLIEYRDSALDGQPTRTCINRQEVEICAMKVIHQPQN